MDQFYLTRTSRKEHGVFGVLQDSSGNIVCVTGEPTWKDNGPDSCIPVGTYLVKQHNSPDHPWTFELQNVPNRQAILIHNGNAPEKDSLGCILVGLTLGQVNGLDAVLDSVRALNKCRAIFAPPFSLTITEQWQN